ncbi:MAG: DUF3224 domain-containing protein [Bacteroidota bacterium]
MKKITGTFSVSMQPLDNYAQNTEGAQLGRMSLDKEFNGPLTAKSQGEMLTAMTSTSGSAGYVAIEKVVGKIEGKMGSFVLQHFGIMHAGENQLILEVVPASGTGELASLSGKMHIRIEEKQHYYDFEYEL